MKIAFIHPSFPSAEGTGATHSATQIVRGLADQGHEIDVYCLQKPTQNKTHTNIKLIHLVGNSKHPHTSTRMNRELSSRINKFSEYDIVHSYLMSLIPSMGEISEKIDVSTVVTLNAYGGICPKNDLLYLNKEQCKSKSTAKCMNCIARTGFSNNEHGYAYQTASQLLSLRLINKGESKQKFIDGYQALSNHVKEKYSNFGFENNKIEVIPNILDKNFITKNKSDFSEPYQLLYVGSLEEHKGVGKLPSILTILQDLCEYEFKLSIVGDGGFKTKLQEEFNDRGLRSNVVFRGHLPYDTLPEIYANHDLFVYPGIWDEPFGRVFFEALAAETPVVATDSGAAADIIGDAGITVGCSATAIAEGIHSIITRGNMNKYRSNTKQEIKKYRSDVVLNKFELLYEKVT